MMMYVAYAYPFIMLTKIIIKGLFRIQHKNKITPYLDLRLRGEVQSTLVAGAEVYTRAGGFTGQPRGRLIVNKAGLNSL